MELVALHLVVHYMSMLLSRSTVHIAILKERSLGGALLVVSRRATERRQDLDFAIAAGLLLGLSGPPTRHILAVFLGSDRLLRPVGQVCLILDRA